tara:strand:+ start:232 stop:621 length:390 start_codon:yes stop_codon:yes gene_type:complete
MLLRIKILFILLFFIQSRIAQGINIHYCGNLVADFSYLYDAEGCNMHNSKFEKYCHISQKTCCHDKVLVYDKNQLETESKTVVLFKNEDSQTFFGDVFIVDKNNFETIPEFPPPKIPIFKINCSLIFYG